MIFSRPLASENYSTCKNMFFSLLNWPSEKINVSDILMISRRKKILKAMFILHEKNKFF